VWLENKRSCKVHEAGRLYIHSKVYNDHRRKVSVPLLGGRVPQRALCDAAPKTCCWGPPARRPPRQRWSAPSHGVCGVGAAAPRRRPSDGPAATVVGAGRPLRGRLLGRSRAAPAPPALPWGYLRRARGPRRGAPPWRRPSGRPVSGGGRAAVGAGRGGAATPPAATPPQRPAPATPSAALAGPRRALAPALPRSRVEEGLLRLAVGSCQPHGRAPASHKNNCKHVLSIFVTITPDSAPPAVALLKPTATCFRHGASEPGADLAAVRSGELIRIEPADCGGGRHTAPDARGGAGAAAL
jgi:hypothetical protein